MALLVVLQTDPIDQAQLLLEVVGVIHFGILELDAEHVTRHVILCLLASRHRRPQIADHLVLERQIGLEHFRHRVADVQRVASREIGRSFKKEDALDQRPRVLPLVVGFMQCLGGQAIKAHVGVHLAVNQVLVYGRQFTSQQGVEDVDDGFIALHDALRKYPGGHGKNETIRRLPWAVPRKDRQAFRLPVPQASGNSALIEAT